MSRITLRTYVAPTSIRSALRFGFVVALALAVVASLVPLAARADTFTLFPGSPSLGLIPAGPADLLWDVPGVPLPGTPPPPSVGYPVGALGLGPLDIVDAISDGFDPVFAPHTDYFSVTLGSVGVAGTGVNTEATILDTPPGVFPGHAADIFVTSPPLGATNILAPAGFGWTLGTFTGDEANAGLLTPSPIAGIDDVNSYDLATIPLGAAVLFSLAPGSPMLIGLGATPADVLGVGGIYGAVPVIVIPAAALGLGVGIAFDMDALAIAVLPPVGGPFLPGSIEYSLTTATAGGVAAALGSGATILGLGAGGVPITVHTPAALGLLATDDLDALDVDQRIVPEPGSLALFGLGAVALAGYAWRRRKRVA